MSDFPSLPRLLRCVLISWRGGGLCSHVFVVVVHYSLAKSKPSMVKNQLRQPVGWRSVLPAIRRANQA